jgi:hypothetical protein
VVAERHDVGARCKKLLRQLRCDPGAVCDVLAVDDAEVCAELFAQPWQVLFDCTSTRDAEDVGEEEEFQLRTSAAAGRISTDT